MRDAALPGQTAQTGVGVSTLLSRRTLELSRIGRRPSRRSSWHERKRVPWW